MFLTVHCEKTFGTLGFTSVNPVWDGFTLTSVVSSSRVRVFLTLFLRLLVSERVSGD